MLVQFGTPREIYEDPDSVYVATRLGQPRINIAAGGGLRRSGRAGGGRADSACARSILPLVAMCPMPPVRRVRRVEHLGDQTRLHLALEGAELVTLAEPHTPIRPGTTSAVGPVDPLFFDAERAEAADA